METIEAAVLMAASHRATLVPLSLISVPRGRAKGARLEHIQQSKDFLEATQQKALWYRVPLERFEVFTGNVVQSISMLAHQLACDGAILALRGQQGSLLSAQIIEQLMATRSCRLYLIYLPARESSWALRLRELFSNWRPGHRQRAATGAQPQQAFGEQATREVVLSRPPGSSDLES